MKNAIVLIALLVVAPLVSQARPLKLECKSPAGVVKATLKIKSEFCRITQKENGVVERLYCGVAGRYDGDNQIFVTGQKNGLSSLSQVENIITNNMAMPVMENMQNTDNVICRLQEVK